MFVNIKGLLCITLLVFSSNFLLLPSANAEKKEPISEIASDKLKGNGGNEEKKEKKKSAVTNKKNTNVGEAKNSSKNSPDKQKKSLDEKKEKNAAAAAELLKEIKREEKDLHKQINLLDISLKENESQSIKLKDKIQKSKNLSKSYKKDIESLNKSISDRNELLKKRVISMQESNSDTNYLELLLGSTNFSNFFQRLNAMSYFMEADRAILELHQKESAELERKQKDVETQLENYKKSKVELNSVKDIIIEQQQQQKDLLKLLNTKKITVKKELDDLKTILIRLPSNAPTPSNALPKVAQVGYQWIGNSVYVFGGGRNIRDVQIGVFDCSSFVYWAFEQEGVNLGDRTSVSTETLNKKGKRIPVSAIKPGDIVFFDTYKVDGHVGIYVGNGKFIGAQSSTGVAVADMKTGYFKSTFKGHVRRL